VRSARRPYTRAFTGAYFLGAIVMKKTGLDAREIVDGSAPQLTNWNELAENKSRRRPPLRLLQFRQNKWRDSLHSSVGRWRRKQLVDSA